MLNPLRHIILAFSFASLFQTETIAAHDSLFAAQQDTFPLVLADHHSTRSVEAEIAESVHCHYVDSAATLSFALSTPKVLSVSIHNLLGQLVAEFPVNNYNPGTHSLSLAAFDLPAGVYFVSFTGTRFRSVRRIFLSQQNNSACSTAHHR